MRPRYASVKNLGDHPILTEGWQLRETRYISIDDETKLPQRIVRTVHIEPPLFSMKSLRRLLAVADRELDKCARMCGALTVPHSWGVTYRRGFKEIIAEVDRIRGVSLESPQANEIVPAEIIDQVTEGVRRYNHPLRKMQRSHLYDMKHDQFMYGVNVADPEACEPSLFLVDIEPLFAPREACY
jgi:hypothetical protein